MRALITQVLVEVFVVTIAVVNTAETTLGRRLPGQWTSYGRHRDWQPYRYLPTASVFSDMLAGW